MLIKRAGRKVAVNLAHSQVVLFEIERFHWTLPPRAYAPGIATVEDKQQRLDDAIGPRSNLHLVLGTWTSANEMPTAVGPKSNRDPPRVLYSAFWAALVGRGYPPFCAATHPCEIE